MKKLACSLVILTSVVAFAAQEKVGTIQIDNMTGLAKSCTKLGDMLGNPMASSVVTGALANNSSVKYFGPMRADAGVSVVLGLYLDAAKLGCTNENDEVMAFTVVYPVVGGKAKFLKLHQDAKEQDDMPVAAVRARYPSLGIVGLSTHNPDQPRPACRPAPRARRPPPPARRSRGRRSR